MEMTLELLDGALPKFTNAMARYQQEQIMGKNVRPRQLKPGQIYVERQAKTSHQANYCQPLTAVKFLGVGRDDAAGNPVLVEHTGRNKAVKDLEDGEYYYFETLNDDGKPFTYSAYEFRGKLCICSGAIPVTFYEANPEEI